MTKPKTPKPVKAWSLVNRNAPYIYAHWTYDERREAVRGLSDRSEKVIPVLITPIVRKRKDAKK